MYIRIEFEDVERDTTKETQHLFFGSPNGTCLASSRAYMVSSKEMRDAVGSSVVFWYLDVDILNKYYGGVVQSLNGLLTYPGVRRVDVLPVEGRLDSSADKYGELIAILMNYVKGV